MFSNFKISRITQDDADSEVFVRFYEGEIITEDERDEDSAQLVPPLRYWRTAMVGEKLLTVNSLNDIDIRNAVRLEVPNFTAAELVPEQINAETIL